MIRKWIPVGLVVGLLAVVVSGGVVLSSGGDPGEGDTDDVVVRDGDSSTISTENTEVETGGPDELAVRVAEILGMDPQATYDAMVQADAPAEPKPGLSEEDGRGDEGDVDSMSVKAEGMSYMEYGERTGAILGVDGQVVARAIARAYEELYGVERDIRDSGSGRDVEGREEPDKHPTEPAGG